MEEYVATVSSALISVIFSSFGRTKIKNKGKMTKYVPLVFFCCLHAEPSFTSRAEWTSHDVRYLILSAHRAVRWKKCSQDNFIKGFYCLLPKYLINAFYYLLLLVAIYHESSYPKYSKSFYFLVKTWLCVT